MRSMKTIIHAVWVLIAAANVASCTLAPDDEAGTKGGPCAKNGKCQGDLVCLGGVCSGGTWTDARSGLTWQNPSSENSMVWQDAINYCAGLSWDGGGWRLPTISELRSLIQGCPETETGGSCGVTDSCKSGSCWSDSCGGCTGGGGPADGCYRPSEMEGSCYVLWSLSSLALRPYFAWYVDFGYGRMFCDNKLYTFYVRCVRGAFTIDGDADVDTEVTGGTWTDARSGLTWQNPSPENRMDWQDAMDYCADLSLDGGGWRLPTISELRTLIRGCDATETGGSCGVTDRCLSDSCGIYSCFGCTGGGGPVDGCYGPSEMEGSCDWFWSSSSKAPDPSEAWGVNFLYGEAISFLKSYNIGIFARCVRRASTIDGDADVDTEITDGDAGEATDGDTDGGGTWTDARSGLTWQNPPPRFYYSEMDAIDYCNELSLDGHSDWRLPTISELRSLIRGCPDTETDGSCGVTDSCLSLDSCRDSCGGCDASDGPGDGCYWESELDGYCGWYWSSSRVEEDNSSYWYVYFGYGFVDWNVETFDFIVRCVRDGS